MAASSAMPSLSRSGGDEPATDSAPTSFQPVADRVDATADLALAWVRLRQAEPPARRVAIVLANYPNRDGRLANGVGLDTPQSLIDVLRAMRGEGYRVGEAPDDGAAMMELLQAGPTNAIDGRAADRRRVWPLARLRSGVRDAAARTCSAPSRRAGASRSTTRMSSRANFASACIASAMSSSACSRRAATTSIRRAPITIPIWCRRTPISPSISGCAASSARMPSCISASTAISNGCPARRWRCRPSASRRRCSGPLPHLYPFIVNDPGEGTQAKRRASAVIIDHLTPPLTRAERYGRSGASSRRWSTNTTLAADLDPSAPPCSPTTSCAGARAAARCAMCSVDARDADQRGAARARCAISASSRKCRSATGCMCSAASPAERSATICSSRSRGCRARTQAAGCVAASRARASISASASSIR